jgi:flagellar motor switch protein FliN/FliY
MSDIDADDILNQGGDEGLMDEWAAALEEQKQAAAKLASPTPAAAKPERVEYDVLADTAEEPADPDGKREVNLDVILDVPVTISMEIGRTRINIRNLLQLSQGSVVELDRLAGEPMDVLVNGTLIAHGEVVVVNDKFGIRLTDVLSPAERVRKLK